MSDIPQEVVNEFMHEYKLFSKWAVSSGIDQDTGENLLVVLDLQKNPSRPKFPAKFKGYETHYKVASLEMKAMFIEMQQGLNKMSEKEEEGPSGV